MTKWWYNMPIGALWILKPALKEYLNITYSPVYTNMAASQGKCSYNFLGRSGLKVSNICLGTMTFGDRKVCSSKSDTGVNCHTVEIFQNGIVLRESVQLNWTLDYINLAYVLIAGLCAYACYVNNSVQNIILFWLLLLHKSSVCYLVLYYLIVEKWKDEPNFPQSQPTQLQTDIVMVCCSFSSYTHHTHAHTHTY